MKKRNEIELLNAYFRAANYLSVAQIYLKDNALLRRPLGFDDVKKKLVGHFGSAPGQNFIYVHLNRIIKKYDLDMMYVSGPGHAGQALISNTFLEGSYSKIYPDIKENEEGINELCRQFSYPGGVSSHAAPETPGSINEGGELGYSLAHSYGAVLDNPNLIVACVIGDGEAETATLSASWQINTLINSQRDGVVLPILHLNGYKIANPTIMGRKTDEELKYYFLSLGYDPYFVCGSNELDMHKQMIKVMDTIVSKIQYIKKNPGIVPHYPVLILRSLKGWTGPQLVNNKKCEGSFRSHQVPFNIESEEDLRKLESWLKEYNIEDIFDENGELFDDLKSLRPDSDHLMGTSKYANGGLLLKKLKVPDFKKYAVDVNKHGDIALSDMTVLSDYIRDVVKLNPKNFMIFGPDEAISNKLTSVFEVTGKLWNGKTTKDDEYLSYDGRVVDGILSENVCQGLLEGYILTGRHGFMHSYEAFIRIVDSMVSQHAKWIKVSSELLWRSPISSLNYILTSHLWQQDHNGFTHQDPGFLNHIALKKPDVSRIYLPYDANSLLSCFDHIIQTKNYINVIVASKHDRPQWLNMEDTIEHCTAGIGYWDWASTNNNLKPDVILACAGDTPTLEVIAASTIIKKFNAKLKVKVINVVDLMKLVPSTTHPHGLTDKEYNKLFDKDVPVIFAFHGYPNLIHELCYKRYNNSDLHVHGYIEEGTITTPFDMRVQNKLDRFNLVLDAMKYVKDFKEKDEIIAYCVDMLNKHEKYIIEHGEDMPDVKNWKFK